MKRFNGHITAGLAVLSVLSASPAARADDPTTADCLGANDKAIALKSQHRFRAARAELLVCAATTCPADIRNECMRRVVEINASMPTVVFEAKDAAGNDLGAVNVTMDGQPLADRLEGTALSIDPGAHTFVFETAGQPVVQKQFVILEGAKDRRERISFGSASAVSAPSAPTEAPPGQTALVQSGGAPAATDTGSGGDTQRLIGWVLTGAGAVGLGLGVVFEVQRSGKIGDAEAVCPSGINCAPGSQNQINALNDDAKSASALATVSFVAGGLLVAGGLVTVFMAPKAESAQGLHDSSKVAILPVVLPDFRGVSVIGKVW